jgi:protein-S-isoprenylcysteine O-methyltransferase Ste14
MYATLTRRASILSPAVSSFSLKNLATRIDLSAWISGASMALGLLMIGPKALASDAFRLMLVFDAYAVFLVTVLLLQRHMRLAMSASTFGKPRELTTSGVFQYTRNPIYVAFLLPLASLAVFSVAAATTAIAVYLITMTITVIRKEERDLQSIFGQNYTSYAAKVPRWLF